ncbi:hypothetical protein J1605_000110, partial [Eschrichtius robustus]
LQTVGISSVQHLNGCYLLDTLQSLFQASSEPEDSPIHLLLSNFSFLLGQTAPISLIPNFFHSQENYFTSKDTCYQEEEGEEEENLSKPDNSPTKIYTDMMVKSSHFPEHAYFLNESYFEIQYPIPGNIYTLILDQLHKVNQIQVLTGIGKLGIYQLKQRQVELGYDPIQEKKRTVRYTMLRPLVKEKFDQKVYYEVDFVEAVRYVSVQLLMRARQESKLWIRQISIWIKSEKR